MPAAIHNRAKHLLAKNPEMDKSKAFAIATQQMHAIGKTPKGYGTSEGKADAKKKYPNKKSYVKTPNPGNLESPKLAALADELSKIAFTPGLAGVMAGFYPGKNVAGETAAAIAPKGRVTRSENVARQLAVGAAPLGGLAGLALAKKHNLAGFVGRHASKHLDLDSIRALQQYGVPLAAGAGGSMAGGAAAGAGVGLVQRLRGAKGKEQEKTKEAAKDRDKEKAVAGATALGVGGLGEGAKRLSGSAVETHFFEKGLKPEDKKLYNRVLRSAKAENVRVLRGKGDVAFQAPNVPKFMEGAVAQALENKFDIPIRPGDVAIGGRLKRPEILAHELGHVQIGRHRLGRLAQNLGTTMLGAGGSSMAFGGAVGAATGMSDSEKVRKAGRWAPALMTLPMLGYEAGASVLGAKRLKRLGATPEQIRGASKGLLAAWGTYGSRAALGTAAAHGGSYVGMAASKPDSEGGEELKKSAEVLCAVKTARKNKDKVRDDLMVGGAGVGSAGYLAPKAREGITGRTRLYHGTRSDLVDKVRKEGVLPSSKTKTRGVVDAVLEGATAKRSKGLAFATRSAGDAATYAAQADALKDVLNKKRINAGDVLNARVQAMPKVMARRLLGRFDKGVITMDTPLWKQKLVSNPEYTDFVKKIDKADIPAAAKFVAKQKMRAQYESSVAASPKGFSPRYMRGNANYVKLTPAEVMEYAGKNKGKFGKGLALGAGALALGGYGAKKLYDAAKEEFGEKKAYNVSEYSGPLGYGPFKQESQIPPFHNPRVKTSGPPSSGKKKQASRVEYSEKDDAFRKEELRKYASESGKERALGALGGLALGGLIGPHTRIPLGKRMVIYPGREGGALIGGILGAATGPSVASRLREKRAYDPSPLGNVDMPGMSKMQTPARQLQQSKTVAKVPATKPDAGKAFSTKLPTIGSPV